jgi:hypothetical protein
MTAPAAAVVSETDVLPGYVNREALARKLGISVRTLDRMHEQRTGPPRISPARPGTIRSRLILYKLSSVEEWLDSLAVGPVRQCRTTRRRSAR